MTAIGSRVGALLSMKNGEAKLLGWGVYEGNHTPDGFPFPNPRIKLDNGDIVWGFQCWWGDEEQMKKEIQDMKIIHVDLEGNEVI